ncbi:MAG TPA: hypothetical protein VD927_16160 [Chryseosolibacter sp.]|nr:hypothetical protein [Chryseosolibacter sp.]
MRIALVTATVLILSACHGDPPTNTIRYEADCEKCSVIYTAEPGVDSIVIENSWSMMFGADPSFVPRLQVWYKSHEHDYTAQKATLRIFVNDEKFVDKSDSGFYFKITGFYIP